MSHLRNALFSLVIASFTLACEGKVLDVGTANRSAAEIAEPEPPVEDAGTATPAVDTSIAGVWTMVRHDGMFGSEVTDPPPPPMELEISPQGEVFRYQCVRTDAATEPCPPSATTDCRPGTIEASGERWQIDIPSIMTNAPEQGETFLTEEGTLVVRYINPTFSAGYFRRIGDSGARGGCSR